MTFALHVETQVANPAIIVDLTPSDRPALQGRKAGPKCIVRRMQTQRPLDGFDRTGQITEQEYDSKREQILSEL